MKISPNIIIRMTEHMNNAQKKVIKEYIEQDLVKIEEFYYEDAENFDIQAKVIDIETENEHKVEVSVQNGRIKDETCACENSKYINVSCEHAIAVVIQAEKVEAVASKDFKEKKNQVTYNMFTQVYDEFYKEELREIENLNKSKPEKVRLEPEITYSEQDDELKISFKIGNKQMYKIKDIPAFYTMFVKGSEYRYGEKVDVVHKLECFDEKSKPYVEFLCKYGEMIKYMNKKLDTTRSYYGKKVSIRKCCVNRKCFR